MSTEQESYMEFLEKLDPAELCWCGWYRLGQCPNCETERSAAEKIAERCPSCHNDGGPHRLKIVHRIGCPAEATQ
jgi:hypothetical protein